MTVLADIRRLEVVRILAGRVEAVVAAMTVAGNADVVEHDGNPGVGRMAVVTLLARRRMRRRFAGSHDPVVTGATTAQHGRVIHVCDRAPGRGRMAVAADFRRFDVVD